MTETNWMNNVLLQARTALSVCFLSLSLLAPGPSVVAQGNSPDRALSGIPGSFRNTIDVATGEFNSPSLSVEVVLAPEHETELNSLLTKLYDPENRSYHQWLGTGEFYNRFAPAASRVAALTDYLQGKGLAVEQTSSPFLLRVSGSSRDISAAFQTTLRNYRNRKGIPYFSNSREVQLPAVLAAGVRGVVGLTNTVRAHANLVRSPKPAVSPVPGALTANSSNAIPGCEAPYPTAQQFFDYVDYGNFPPFGYGGGPECTGLTPSQINSIYGAPNLGPSAQGLGVTLAVFELTGYSHSDIAAWAQTFYGPAFSAPLVDITVDGGPLNPICPPGDECPASINGYWADFEAVSDIEMQLAISPHAKQILVYNAPNDYTGQTGLDEFARIAEDNRADVLSISYGFCENDAGAAYVQAENLIFQQMALQGQSAFTASGDSGAFDCILEDGTTVVNVEDPASQPWVTGVGGTSLESFNPNANPNPKYPAGIETVWNVDGLCNASDPSAANDNYGGFFWCYLLGGGGGGNSQYWGRPLYQLGPGITNPYTTYGNNSTQCAFAKKGTPCREIPDISANADQFTPYAVYCTGDASTPNSLCLPPYYGWVSVGGTSLSTPVWSGIIADRDGFWRGRIGNANPYLYLLYNANYQGYFHDINGVGQAIKDNGLYPVTPGFDLATGIGTPKMAAIITGVPQK